MTLPVKMSRNSQNFPRFTRLLQDEEGGSFVNTVVFLAVVGIIMAIVIIDGASIFYAFRAANQVTEEAATNASTEYKLYRSESRAEKAAIDHCEEEGLEFVEIVTVPELGTGSYSVTCAVTADTFVFKRLPYFKTLAHQESTQVSGSN
jgi:Flp pilus assembly protein TadG